MEKAEDKVEQRCIEQERKQNCCKNLPKLSSNVGARDIKRRSGVHTEKNVVLLIAARQYCFR